VIRPGQSFRPDISEPTLRLLDRAGKFDRHPLGSVGPTLNDLIAAKWPVTESMQETLRIFLNGSLEVRADKVRVQRCARSVVFLSNAFG
jgi:hypothetical protein